MGMSAEDYLAQLQALLPSGDAWPREKGTTLYKLLQALADEFERVDGSGDSLLEESDPRTTQALLLDWERIAGLPDSCVGEQSSIDARRAQLVGKLTARGDQSRQYFIDLAADLGYTITITEFDVFTCESECEDPIYDEDWRFAWQVNAPEDTIREATCESPCTDPLRSWGNTLLECVMNQLKPAHTVAIFSYS